VSTSFIKIISTDSCDSLGFNNEINCVGWTWTNLQPSSMRYVPRTGRSENYTFQMKDKSGQDVKRTTQHSMYTTRFLQGQTTYTPGIILEHWYHSADGHVHGRLAQEVPMYATTQVYTKIKPAHAASTAFAAQIVKKKLVQERMISIKILRNSRNIFFLLLWPWSP